MRPLAALVSLMLATTLAIAVQAGQRISYSPKLRIYQDGDCWEYSYTNTSESLASMGERTSNGRSRTSLKLVKSDGDFNWFEATAASTGMSLRNMSAPVATTVTTFEQHIGSGNVFFVSERHLLSDFQTSPPKAGGLIYPGAITNESVIEGSTSLSGPRAKGQGWRFVEDAKAVTNHGDLDVKAYGNDIMRNGKLIFSGRIYVHPTIGNVLIYIHEWTGADGGLKRKTVYRMETTNVKFSRPG